MPVHLHAPTEHLDAAAAVVTNDPATNVPDLETPPDPPETTAPEPAEPAHPAPRLTRLSAVWAATSVALLLLVLLVVFILQNPTRVRVHFLGMTGSVQLGMAMLIASVVGGVTVAIVGVGRMGQLRMVARRARRDASNT